MSLFRWRYATFLAAFLGVVFLFTGAYARAEPLKLQESRIKAGLFYNFLKYTHWPPETFASENDPLQICLLGGDSFDGALNPLQGMSAQKRPINIRKTSQRVPLASCHAVYVHPSHEEHLTELLSRTAGQPILIVSDIENFVQKGGMVEFSKTKHDRIRLNVNHNSLRTSALSVEKHLLDLVEAER